MQQIQALWPRCKFLHLIRNGLDVAASMSKHPGFQWIMTSGEATWCSASFSRYYSVVEATEHPLTTYVGRWCHSVNRIRDEATRIRQDSYKEVFYENILANPATVIQDIAAFASVDPDPDWLAILERQINPAKLAHENDITLLSCLRPEETALMQSLGYI